MATANQSIILETSFTNKSIHSIESFQSYFAAHDYSLAKVSHSKCVKLVLRKTAFQRSQPAHQTRSTCCIRCRGFASLAPPTFPLSAASPISITFNRWRYQRQPNGGAPRPSSRCRVRTPSEAPLETGAAISGCFSFSRS